MADVAEHLKGLRDAMVHVTEHAQALIQKLPALEADVNRVLAKKAEADQLAQRLKELSADIEAKTAEKDRLDKALDKIALDAQSLLNSRKK